MKGGSGPLKRPPDDPLERAHAAAEDARDIARDALRRLPDYDDTEESTARHELPPRPELPAIHVHMDSIHDSDPPAKKVRAGLMALGSGIGLALFTGVAALMQNCGHH